MEPERNPNAHAFIPEGAGSAAWSRSFRRSGRA